MVTGSAVTAVWIVFVKDAEAQALGICHALFGVPSLLAKSPNWPVVDPLVIALPLSAIVMIAVSLFTKRPSARHLSSIFPKAEAQPRKVVA